MRAQARVGPGGALGERLFRVLSAQAHLPPDARVAGVAGRVTLESLTVAKATLESGSDDEVVSFGALLLTQRDASAADVAALVADLLTAVYADAEPAAARAAAQAIAEQTTTCLREPAALRTLRCSLSVPRAPPWTPPQLDWRGTTPRVALMQPAWAWLLSPHLPPACQQRWSMLFSSEAHGASISTLMGRCVGRGAALVLVRDKGGVLAAGFSDAPLVKRAAFFGGYSSLLAALLPRARVYKPTGNNDHMVWCADGFESVPNGIGFGGQARV